jgi:hypothetical protein
VKEGARGTWGSVGGGAASYIGRLGLSFFSWVRRISRSSSGANIDAGPQG